MDFNSWQTSAGDPVRRKRLLAGYTVGAIAVAGFATFITLTASGVVAAPEEEEVVDVSFADEPEEKVEPEPEPAPEPEPQVQAPGPRMPTLETPVEVPEAAPEEAEPSKDAGEGGDPYANAGGGGKGPPLAKAEPAAPPPPPPPAPKAKAAGPIRVTENVTPPVSVSQPAPAYPAAAKAAGVEGTVIVKYAVGTDGAVTVAKAVRGPAELRAACEATVKSWRFKPALLDGAAVSVWRIARFPFRIKT
ncbi:MAG TPA: TonB family protein [Polyangiaceae bacterium]|nr:TonB family protein [Polyangiaceae bacterium]